MKTNTKFILTQLVLIFSTTNTMRGKVPLIFFIDVTIKVFTYNASILDEVKNKRR